MMAEKDYKKSNRKIGVFPIDWIVMKSFENMDVFRYDQDNAQEKVSKFFMNPIRL